MSAVGSVINTDTIDLYSAAASVHGDGNLMISPLSILYCSMLLYLGAETATKTNLESSLHFNKVFYSDRSAALNAFVNGLPYFANASLNSNDNFLTTTIVNEIFVSNQATLRTQYQQSVQALQSIAQTKDFKGQPDQSRQEINQEVARNTANTIQNLLPPGSITEQTVIVLVNTLYFKATWSSMFEDWMTTKAPFTQLNGQIAQVDTMHQVLFSANYTEDNDLDIQFVELPFYSRNASMLILLPRQTNGLRKLEKALNQQYLQSLGQSAMERRVDLFLPKFTFSASFDLVKILKALGFSNVFSASTSDLSGMINGISDGTFPPVFVSSGFHQTFISVDEKGTEAAAASALVGLAGSAQNPPPAVVFKADHPFLFIIRNNPSKATMFIGRVESF
ncbi:ovalbumin-related protein X-like [Paramacrobiotus metropolitanus]|uniref:ovalbumin-related protein X-like n=1 Tax=Paramacrobiotus metropolitanus TaxID=2943436 RepID=UPI002445CB36|nr:ovalbumin-related protein X-like [Paramacrobiotus metropolitanus]